MTRNQKWKEKLMANPVRYAKYLEKKRKKKKEYWERIKNDPIRHSNFLKKVREYNRKKYGHKPRKENRKGSKYEKYFKYNPFRKMAKSANKRCKCGRVSPFQLWCLAKKQKLICALTGRKLTIENISIDHKISISNGGTNEISNLQLVTIHANKAKNSMTDGEFYLFCKDVVNKLAPIVREGTTSPKKSENPPPSVYSPL